MLLEESNLKFKVTFKRRLLFSQRTIRRCQQRKTSFLRLSPIKETPGRKVFTDLSIYVV